MKRKKALSLLMVLFLSAGCSTLPLPGLGKPTAIPATPVMTPSPEATATYTSQPTPTPTTTLTPSPTVYHTPTETSHNFVLAETGYDIADVRYSYPRPDMLVIDFKYRLDENIKSNWTMIQADVPQRCQDNAVVMFYLPQDDESPEVNSVGLYFFAPAPDEGAEPVGEGRISFKMTVQGICYADGLDFLMYPLERANTPDTSYKEFVFQPFEVTRDFPTLNSDQITIKNFYYQPTGSWRGVLTFEYQVSEAIPIPPEEYHFQARFSGRNADCSFSDQGPRLSAHSGTYEIPIDLLAHHLDEIPGCLDPAMGLRFSSLAISLFDELAYSHVFRQDVSFSFTVNE